MINYLQYVEDHSELSKENFDLLYYRLDSCIWFHSDYWRNPIQIYKVFESKEKKDFAWLFQKLIGFASLVFKKILTEPQKKFFYKEKKENKDNDEIIVFQSYFNFKADFPFKSIELFDFSFLNSEEYENDIKLISEVDNILQKEGLGYLLSLEMNEKINRLKESLFRIYSDKRIKAFFTYADCDFWSRILLLVFKKLNKPTFLYVHGMPGVYKSIYNRSDFLLVWSEKMKENFENAGISKEKMILYQNKKYTGKITPLKKMDLENVVVLGHTMPGADPCGIKTNSFQRNFGISLLYADLVKNVLLKLGVKKAVLRPHPSENLSWYMKNVDTLFYSIDTFSSDVECLQKASLVIGPSSTMLINSLYHGVPYILFEPIFNGEEVSIFNLVPPFDGTDSYVPLCRTEDDLYSAIKDQKYVNQELLCGYNTTVDEYDKLIDIIRGKNG